MIQDVFLCLSITPKVGWSTIDHLNQVGIDQSVFNLDKIQWKKRYPFLNDNQALALSETVTKNVLFQQKKKLEALQIQVLTPYDPEYPPLLKEIFNPPWVLYAWGDLTLLSRPGLGVVGSRKTTHYGRHVTEKLVPELVHKGWVIVSGLALGIDAISHESTLQAGGKTVAVLGSGIDVIYPKNNRHLYERIKEQGLLLSEYPPGTPAIPAYFPQRNRIISGLSHGIIVVEAAKKSGSLITAHLALEQGRDVFAIPGSIFDFQSVGTNLLIQQGAKLVTNALDIVDEFPHVSLPLPQEKKDHGLNEGIMVEDIEKEILEVLKFEKKHMNEILSLTGTSMTELSHYMLKLEMKGFIKALPGSFYQKISSFE